MNSSRSDCKEMTAVQIKTQSRLTRGLSIVAYTVFDSRVNCSRVPRLERLRMADWIKSTRRPPSAGAAAGPRPGACCRQVWRHGALQHCSIAPIPIPDPQGWATRWLPACCAANWYFNACAAGRSAATIKRRCSRNAQLHAAPASVLAAVTILAHDRPLTMP